MPCSTIPHSLNVTAFHSGCPSICQQK